MTSLTFSVNVEDLSSKPHDYYLKATPEERQKVAKRLNLLSVEKLEAQLHLQRKGQIFVSGTIAADVTQECVRTLIPLPQNLTIPVEEVFTLMPLESEKDIDLEMEELAEPLQGNTLDLGEVVIQLLSLNLDPYPTAPESTPFEYQEKKPTSSPFEILKKKK